MTYTETDVLWMMQSYLDLADELSVNVDPTVAACYRVTLDDFAGTLVDEARTIADALHLQWPPPPCVDTAGDLLDRACRELS